MENIIKDIKEKAHYCLNCKTKPCQKGCPLENDIPEFINYIKQDDYKEAYKVLSKTTVLQPICGRICPHMSQCQGSCIRGIKSHPTDIGELEAFVGDIALERNYSFTDEKVERKDKNIAVIGSGPAGLTCSAFLARQGYRVTIYEKYDKLGGILSHGIPEFRLDRDVLNKTINKIIDTGIEVKYNTEIGKNIKLEDLQDKYDAIFLAFGANISSNMEIEGEELEGVYGR